MTIERAPVRLSPPDWFVGLAIRADLSLLEFLALWLHYCDAGNYEIGVVLSRKERSVGEAIARAQRKVAGCREVVIGYDGDLVDALRARLGREAAEVLAAVRNEIGRRGGTHGEGEHMPKIRQVTVDDLVEPRLARLFGSLED